MSCRHESYYCKENRYFFHSLNFPHNNLKLSNRYVSQYEYMYINWKDLCPLPLNRGGGGYVKLGLFAASDEPGPFSQTFYMSSSQIFTRKTSTK
jgi:hypothetical protein